MRWPTGALDSIAILDRQSIHPSEAEAATPYLGLEHLDGDGGINCIQTVGSAALKSNKFQFSDRHVLFGKLRHRIFARSRRPGFSGVCSTDIIPILPKDGVSRDYLFYFLRAPDTVNLASNRCSGVNLPRSEPETTLLKSFRVPLPPLAEQKRIARILDAADALRAKRREALAQLDTLLQSTFLDMFGDPVTNPLGWEVQPLNELLGEKSTNGAYYPKDAYSSVGTRMVHMANAFYGVVNPNEVKRVDAPPADTEKYGLLPTDILVSRRSLNYEGSAKPCLIPETDEPLIFESSLIRVRPDREKVLTIYLFHYLLNDRARAKYVFPLVTRSTISGISQSNLMKVKVVLPPLDLQLRFAVVVESIERQKAASEPTSPNSTPSSPPCNPAPSGETSEPPWKSPPTSRS